MIYLNIIVTLVSAVLIGLILRLPKLITRTWLEDTKNKHAHEIQIESYFKQLGGKQQQEILSIWTDFLTDTDNATKKYSDARNPDSIRRFNKLLHDTVIYGSDRTVNILTSYTHNMYETVNIADGNKILVYIAFIISSLKEDFSGYHIDPLSLLKLKLKDYDKYSAEYGNYAKEIEREIGDNNYVWNNRN